VETTQGPNGELVLQQEKWQALPGKLWFNMVSLFINQEKWWLHQEDGGLTGRKIKMSWFDSRSKNDQPMLGS
jgi:predicted P-loop ATPase